MCWALPDCWAFPFVISLWRLLVTSPTSARQGYAVYAPDRHSLAGDSRTVGRILVASVICGLAAVALLPLNPSVEAGRYGSICGPSKASCHPSCFGTYIYGPRYRSDSAIWLAVATVCWRRREVIPTVVLFTMFVGTLLVQEFCFQRYLEEPMLLTLAVFIAWQTRLPKLETWIWGVCFGAYTLLGWVKLFQGFGGMGH